MKTNAFKRVLSVVKPNEDNVLLYFSVPVIIIVTTLANNIEWSEVTNLEMNFTNIVRLTINIFSAFTTLLFG